MPINRGSEDTIRDHPDAPKRTRRKSKLAVSDADIAALRKHLKALARAAERERELKALEPIHVQGELL